MFRPTTDHVQAQPLVCAHKLEYREVSCYATSTAGLDDRRPDDARGDFVQDLASAYARVQRPARFDIMYSKAVEVRACAGACAIMLIRNAVWASFSELSNHMYACAQIEVSISRFACLRSSTCSQQLWRCGRMPSRGCKRGRS